jgi:hypothetical protein
MCDFNHLNDEQKLYFHQLLTAYANDYGGINFFLQLIEALRSTKPHPLSSKHRDFLFSLGDIRWNKVIFNDKILLLEKIRRVKNESDNFLPAKEDKEYKAVLNLVRTLSPIVFNVIPQRPEDGKGFTFQVFDMQDEETMKLTPIFEALFFCSIDTVKKILNYKIR